MNDFVEVSCSAEEGMLYGYYQHNGSRNNLVLIPGSKTHHSIWKPVIANAAIDANILLVELPGFGKSDLHRPNGTIEQYTAWTLKLIDAAGMNRFVVGGHSIGGMMAIEMLDHAAERLDGVISCEGWTHYSVEKEAFRKLKNETLTSEQLALRSHFGGLGKTGKWSDEDERAFNRIWTKWEKGLELLERAEVPVLQIWGDRGLQERPSRQSMLIPRKDNIRIVWIERGGHSLLVQVPDLIGRTMAEFMDEVRGS